MDTRVTARGFCNHPGGHAVAPATGSFAFLQRPDWPHCAKSSPTVKEMVPNDSNTIIATMRNAGRGIALSPALPANTCMAPVQTYPVTCSITGPSSGSLSQIVTTQVTHPGKQGTPGDGFPSSLGMLTRLGK